MSIVRKSIEEIRKRKGRIDRAKIASLTDADRERMKREEGFEDQYLSEPEVVAPTTDVRALREHLGLSQESFAQRFLLPLRTLQDWEQRRREPSETARVLLFAIATDPVGMEHILHSGKRTEATG
jgi:DNA-binding transcriptional regulator YiaG